MLSFAQLRDLFIETFKDWNEDKAPRLAAALAYYTIFSLAPLLLIAIAVAGLVFGADAARGEVINQVRGFIGESGAEAISGLLESSNRTGGGRLAAVIGFVTLLFGAAGVFGQLKDAMNTIWEVAPRPDQGIWGFIRTNVLSFTMVLAVGFLLLVSLLISTAVNALATYFAGGAAQSAFWVVANFAVQAAVTFGLFTLIFKELPDAEIAWRDVFLGAAFTTVLFAIGRYLISFYLAQTATGSTFGAAGSLVVILVWIYFSAQILFFGAEFTQVYARRYGSRIKPAENAVPATEEMRAEQGMPDPQVLAATAAVADGKHPETAAAAAVERHQGGPGAEAPLAERAVGEPAPRADVARPAAESPADPAAQQPAPAKDSKTGTVLAGATIFSLLGVIARGARGATRRDKR